jgi:hypothetical protein
MRYFQDNEESITLGLKPRPLFYIQSIGDKILLKNEFSRKCGDLRGLRICHHDEGVWGILRDLGEDPFPALIVTNHSFLPNGYTPLSYPQVSPFKIIRSLNRTGGEENAENRYILIFLFH